MEVILREDISSLGKAGQIVKVRDGFARNYLLPAKKAVLADRKNLKELEHHQKVIALKQTKLVKIAQELKSKLDQFQFSVEKEVGEEDKLFGSLTTMEIVENLKKAGFDIDRKMIHLSEPIKTLGEHSIAVKLMSEVVANVKVTVNSKA